MGRGGFWLCLAKAGVGFAGTRVRVLQEGAVEATPRVLGAGWKEVGAAEEGGGTPL